MINQRVVNLKIQTLVLIPKYEVRPRI